MEDQNKKKWTVFFLIGFVEEFIKELQDLIVQVLSVPKSNEIEIVICLNIKVEKIPKDYPRGELPYNEGWTTLFYNIKCNGDGICYLNLIEEKKKFDIRNPKHVSDFFRKNILRQCMADEYILFTWDHGQPFGIFPHDDSDDVKAFSKSELKIVANKNHIFQPFLLHSRVLDFYHKEQKYQYEKGHFNIDDTIEQQDLQMLTITELKNSIKIAFGKKKIAILVMVNCYLQFFDTGYELSNCVNYQVAFETDMNYRNAPDYKFVLKALSDNPNISARNLAKLLVSSFAIYNVNDRVGIADKALFANDLSWYPCMAKLIDELASILLRELPRHFNQISAAIEKCAYISPNIPEYCLVDFRNFVQCLYNEIPGLFIGNLYLFINSTLDKIVIESFIGKDFEREIGPQYISPTGFSIYFPNTLEMYKTSFLQNFMSKSSISPTEFTRYFYWETFINSFINFKCNQ